MINFLSYLNKANEITNDLNNFIDNYPLDYIRTYLKDKPKQVLELKSLIKTDILKILSIVEDS